MKTRNNKVVGDLQVDNFTLEYLFDSNFYKSKSRKLDAFLSRIEKILLNPAGVYLMRECAEILKGELEFFTEDIAYHGRGLDEVTILEFKIGDNMDPANPIKMHYASVNKITNEKIESVKQTRIQLNPDQEHNNIRFALIPHGGNIVAVEERVLYDLFNF